MVKIGAELPKLSPKINLSIRFWTILYFYVLPVVIIIVIYLFNTLDDYILVDVFLFFYHHIQSGPKSKPLPNKQKIDVDVDTIH